MARLCGLFFNVKRKKLAVLPWLIANLLRKSRPSKESRNVAAIHRPIAAYREGLQSIKAVRELYPNILAR